VSFQLDAKVDGRTIHNRKQKLMALQRRISKARNRKMIGREVDVLIEGPSADTDLLWQARMSTQAPEIDGFCYVNDFSGAPPRRGEIRRMRITETHDYDLIGALDVASEEPMPIMAANAFPILAARP
jgi:ribosomal protein S12 methylthiotransferase